MLVIVLNTENQVQLAQHGPLTPLHDVWKVEYDMDEFIIDMMEYMILAWLPFSGHSITNER